MRRISLLGRLHFLPLAGVKIAGPHATLKDVCAALRKCGEPVNPQNVHTDLNSLSKMGLVSFQWLDRDDLDIAPMGRRRVRHYTLTEEGLRCLEISKITLFNITTAAGL